jgi:putative transposase
MTSEIVRNFRWIGIEDLNVSGMMKNHKLAQSIQDASFFEIRRQLEYKAKLSGSEVIPIHRFYPSSKICHMCGWKNQSLKLSERTWECDSCGIKQDRDVNAAKNIEKVALGHRETLVELFEFDRKRLWSAKGRVESGR